MSIDCFLISVYYEQEKGAERHEGDGKTIFLALFSMALF